MKIHFEGNTNNSKLFLNGIVLIMKDGSEITLDREWTEWSVNDMTSECSITFTTPYIWDVEGQEYDGKKILEAIDNAKYFLSDIEEDAPADYELNLKELSFIDSNGEEHNLKHYTEVSDYWHYLYRPTYKLYQLRKDCENRHELIFESLERIKKHGYEVKSSNYEEVYSGLYNNEMTLESLYHEFNAYRPKDFKGHSLSVSDVIVLSLEGRKMAYYCDSFGFVAVPQFFEKEDVA